MQVTMKSYRVRRDEIAVIDHHGAHRVTQHWPLAARAWPPIAAPALPAEALLRLSVGRVELTLGTTLLVVMLVLLIGAIPGWPYSRGWGYGPSGSIGLALAMLLVLSLRARIWPERVAQRRAEAIIAHTVVSMR